MPLRLPTSIYIGGGTPSILSEKQIKFLFNNLFKYINICLNPCLEFTVELNPESVTESKLKILKNFGVNRLSIGLQVYDDKLLKFLGRVHTVNDFLVSYNLARKMDYHLPLRAEPYRKVILLLSPRIPLSFEARRLRISSSISLQRECS